MEYCCAAKINEYSRLRKDSSTNKAKGGFGGAEAVLLRHNNHNCSHVVKAENDVIIVDPPNWPQKPLPATYCTFPHVTNNAKSKSGGFSHGYGDTPAVHDVVDFRKGDSHNYSNCCKGAFASLYISVRKV
jgi:hypothetical protein